MLDPRLLHAFVTVADTGSFTEAAQRLNSTQSTVSQQIGRLEDAIRHTLLDRASRPARLTPAGERLIGHARRILALQDEARELLADPSGSRTVRLGLPDDLVTRDMSRAFAGFIVRHPEVRLDVTTGLSRDLSRRFRAGEFEIAVVKEAKAEGDVRVGFSEPLAWFEAAGCHRPWPDPVPLVAFPPDGLYREDMIEAVEREGRRWYLAFTGNSLSSVLHAVEAGLGMAILPTGVIGAHKLRRSAMFGEVQPMTLSVYAWEHDGPTAELLAAVTRILAIRRGRAGG